MENSLLTMDNKNESIHNSHRNVEGGRHSSMIEKMEEKAHGNYEFASEYQKKTECYISGEGIKKESMYVTPKWLNSRSSTKKEKKRKTQVDDLGIVENIETESISSLDEENDASCIKQKADNCLELLTGPILSCNNNKSQKSIKNQSRQYGEKIKDSPSMILYKEFLENYNVISYHNTLRIYDGTAYISMNLDEFLGRVLEMLEYTHHSSKLSMTPTMKQMQDTMRFMQASLMKGECEVVQRENKDKNLMAFNNCLYDAYEKIVYPHSSSKLTLFNINARYIEGDVETPVFDRFIQSIDVSGDAKRLKKLVLQMIGYCMVYNTDGKCFFYLGTEHDAGKSVLGAFIQELFNENAICNTAIHDLNSRFSLGSLHEKALCISMDLSGTTMSADAVARLKNLTGDRRIQTEEKYMPVRSTYHNCKFIFGSNYSLRTNIVDEAFWSRVVIIPFVKSFNKDEQDTNILRNLLKEKDEIVTLAARSYKKLVDNHFVFPSTKVSSAMLAEWKGDRMNEVVQFVESECILEQDEYSFTEDLYGAYCNYCEEHILHPLPKTEFSKKLSERYDVTNRKRRLNGNSCHGYYGIGLKSEKM